MGVHIMKRKSTRVVFRLVFSMLLGACDQNNSSINDRYQEGYDSGKQDGQSEGYSSGYDAGKADGQEEGYNDGYADDYADGEEGASAGDYEEGYYANEPVFNFHTDLQSQFLNGSSLSVPDSITGLEEISKPASVVLFANDDARYENKDVTKYVLKLSESKTMTDAREIESPTKRFDLKGLNLNIGRRYFYTTRMLAKIIRRSNSI